MVEPPSGPDKALARAAARTAEARRLARTAAAAAAPSTASRTPTARLSTDLVAITAARQASAASASALASGTSCCPVTAMSCAGSGRGGVKMACAQAWRDGEHDQAGADRAGQQHQDEFPTHHCNSTSASKQVRSPVWQAAPTWSTLTTRASPSQSSATDLTHW